jgi:hypothetical protein
MGKGYGMSRIIRIKHQLDCNAWTCGRCQYAGVGLAKSTCCLDGKPRVRKPNGDYCRTTQCISADTDLTPCEGGCRREGTHTDSEGNALCTPCWNALVREDKAENERWRKAGATARKAGA